MKKLFVTPQTTLYREVSGELVVIQLDRSRFYYFSKSTQGFLEFFREPRRFEDYLSGTSVAASEEKDYLVGFCDDLVAKGILRETDEAIGEAPMGIPYERPVLLREAEKTLEQLSFTCLPD